MNSEASARGWTPLRLFVVGVAIAAALSCAGAFVQWWRIPNGHRDGLELIGPAIAAFFFIVFGLPALVLGLIGRWLIAGAILGVVAVALGTDVIWPWLPWW